MAYRSDTYTSVANRLKDWMQDASDTGGNVTSRILDLVNRANQSLWMERPWAGLVVRSALTLSSGKTYTLPAACGVILDVYHDTDSDGRPDGHYYEDSSDTARGYYVSRSYAKDTGFAQTITFMATPSSAPYIRYVKLLEDFAGTGTEYLYFPSELLVAKAQMFHLEDGGLSAGDMYKAIQQKFTREMTNFMQSQQFENREQRMMILDDQGTEVSTDRYNLGGGPESEPSPYDPSYDLRSD